MGTVLKPLAVSFSALVLAGCAAKVTVLNEQGVPVARAHVDPVHMSFHGPRATTNDRGVAWIRASTQVLWLQVTYPDGSMEQFDWPTATTTRGRGVRLPLAGDSHASRTLVPAEGPSGEPLTDHSP